MGNVKVDISGSAVSILITCFQTVHDDLWTAFQNLMITFSTMPLEIVKLHAASSRATDSQAVFPKTCKHNL